MRKILKHKTSFLTRLAFAASYGNGLHPYFAILIEIISCIQILYLILTTSFSVSNEKNLLIFPKIRDLFSFLGLYDGSSNFETEISTELVWYGISVGLCLYISFLCGLAILCLKEKKLKKGIIFVCTWLTTLHSRILFCPIYYFYVNSILNQQRCALNNQSLGMCGGAIKAFTLIFLIINGVLAILKEALCYQSYKNGNPLATKNNFHALIQLLHKITVVPIVVLASENIIPGSLLNFFFTLPCLVILFVKLPYYNIKVLRTTVCLVTISTTLSFVLLWKIFVKSHTRIFELLVILIIPVFIKLKHERLNVSFERILSLRATSPEYVMHLHTLVEEYIFYSGEVDLNRNSKYKTLFKWGVLQVTGLDLNAMENVSEIKNFKDEANLLVLAELLSCYKKNPKSRALLLYITQFYMQKIKNASQAVVYIQKMQNMPLTIPIQNTLVKMKDKLKSELFLAYSQKDPSLEFINYFKYREISRIIKENIVSEVQLHIEFWQTISKDKVEVRKIIDISEKVDILASKVQRMWERHEKDFIKNFPVPLILYKAYLAIIRGVPHIAQGYIDTSLGHNKKVVKSMEKWFSQEKASIVGSIQKGTLGIVLDASHSVQNLFNIKKEDLIGRKVNILMPNMIQEKHDSLIDSYNQKPEYTLDVKNNVYCKTVDGQFFDAKLELKVYPYIDKGIGLIGMLTKKRECELMFFLDVDGNIVDCSSELLNDFRANFTLSKHINIEEIAPELKKMNEAFNVVNFPKSLELSPSNPAFSKQKSETRSRILSKVIKEDTPIPTERKKSSIRQNQIFTFLEKETNLDSATRLVSTRQNETQRTEPFFPYITTEREQMISPLDTRLDTFKSKDEPEIPRSKNIAALFLTHLTTKHSQPVTRDQARREFINLNEAEKICQEFNKEKKISFFAQDPLSNNFAKLTYFAKTDIFWFENQCYKVLKVRKPTKKDMTFDDDRTPRWWAGSKRESQLAVRSRGNSLLENRLRDYHHKSPKVGSRVSCSASLQGLNIDIVSGEENNNNTLRTFEAVQGQEEQNPGLIQRRKSKEAKRGENLKVEKLVYDLLKKAKESTFTKVYFTAFYFAMLLMLILATINFAYTRSSFDQIEVGAKLVDDDTVRFVSLVRLWAMANAIHTFMLQNKTLPDFMEYTPLIYSGVDTIKTMNKELSLLLPDIDSEDVTNSFYSRDITFWDAFSSTQSNTVAYDVFNGMNIIADNLQLFANSTRDRLLDDPDTAMFGLNNSVNGLAISAFEEMNVVMTVRDRIYSDNKSLLLALLSIEIAAMVIIFLSLFGLALKIRNTQRKLFTVLSTVPARVFEARNRELIQFRDWLQESIENRKFIMQLNSLVENPEAKRNTQVKEFKLKDIAKFNFASIRMRAIIQLCVAFVLFTGIVALQAASSAHSTASIAHLKKIDSGAYVVQVMGYQANMLHGNFIFWMNFYNQATIRIYNGPPEFILNENLARLTASNKRLLSIFNAEDSFYSPDIDKILHSNACPYLTMIEDLCKVATKGEILGLLGINLQMYELVTTYLDQFNTNRTIQNAEDTVYAYLMVSRPYVATLDRGFNFVRESLMQSLLDTIDDENDTNRPLFIATCFVCAIVTVLVRLIVLRKLKRLDKSKYKILMIIPQETIFNNKAMALYLRNEFIQELKSIL